jgi:hypothetical protein
VNASRFAVGIDLGTTNSALSFVPLETDDIESISTESIPVPQLTAPGSVEERFLLPSFIYIPHPDEFSATDMAVPWDPQPRFIVGELARARGTSTPIRLVSSAKSWLCNPGVDRRAPILPPEAPAEIAQVSPYQASICCLEYLRDAWNYKFPNDPLQNQDVVLTVPASFDPAARELTAEAARESGLQNMVLLEEPQAAFYSWIQSSSGSWRKQVKVGEIILVIDVGGGTTDFSLIAVTEHGGSVELRRIAVGDHILLGGDNMDLALAHLIGTKLSEKGTPIDVWQLQALTHGCRAAKEALFADPNTKSFPVVVPTRGSKLIGKTLRTELTHDEVERAIVEGFFPQVEVTSHPAARARSALTRVGLPYAQDPGITRHLAAFLSRQVRAAGELEGFHNTRLDAGFIRPAAVLFNGGVFKAGLLVERTLAVLNSWIESAGSPPARLLAGNDLDMAVANGAAYYARVRRGRGVRIRGGAARSFYVGIESAMPAVPGVEPPIQALCIAPFGMEEGTDADLPPQTFGLVVGEPVRFRFFGSSVRRSDSVGAVLESWPADELEELDNVQATLPADGRTPGDIVPVSLRAKLTEIGTLKLEAVPRSGSEHWAVEFNVRGGNGN